MKKAKKLGSTPQDVEQELRIDIEDPELGRSWVFRPNDIGPAETQMCRVQTGLPFESYMAAFGQDSVIVVIWLARVLEGERINYAQVLKEYGPKEALSRLNVSINEPDEDDDEADEVDPTPVEG